MAIVNISVIQGDMFENPSEVLVNAVNCCGVMGAGLALQFKKRFPENYEKYKEVCENGLLRPGKIFLSPTFSETNPKYIVDFPTVDKLWVSGGVTLDDIKNSLKDLVQHVIHFEVKSISIPALGCGIAGFDWDDILPLILAAFTDRSLNNVDCEVFIFKPQEKK